MICAGVVPMRRASRLVICAYVEAGEVQQQREVENFLGQLRVAMVRAG